MRIWGVGLAIAACLWFASPVRGGGKEGHGGSAVVCRDGQGALQTVTLLDLYEAREANHLVLAERPGTAGEIARAMLDRLLGASRRTFDEMPSFVEGVIAKKNVLSPGVGVEPVDDVFPAIRPKTCRIEPLANYREDGTVL